MIILSLSLAGAPKVAALGYLFCVVALYGLSYEGKQLKDAGLAEHMAAFVQLNAILLVRHLVVPSMLVTKLNNFVQLLFFSVATAF